MNRKDEVKKPGLFKRACKALWNETVFSNDDFWEWTPTEFNFPKMHGGSIFPNTPREPSAEEYKKAGGAKGEYERNKAKYLEMHDPNADKAFNDACNKYWDKFYTMYCKPFDWIESKLPRIK